MTSASPSTTTSIEADPSVPLIRATRRFAANPAQVLRAHLDPDLFVRWVGPDDLRTRIDYWDARSGGSWRYVAERGGQNHAFRGCFHTVTTEPGAERIVQTFAWEGMPDAVALETLRFEGLEHGHTLLVAESLVESFEARDAWLHSGMETGVTQGYAKLDAVLATG